MESVSLPLKRRTSMTKPFSTKQKSEWKKKIFDQKESKLSISDWCRQNQVAVHQFYYWKAKLFPRESLERTSFTELQDKIQTNVHESADHTVLLDLQRIRIQIDPHMDGMERLIKQLKELIC